MWPWQIAGRRTSPNWKRVLTVTSEPVLVLALDSEDVTPATDDVRSPVVGDVGVGRGSIVDCLERALRIAGVHHLEQVARYVLARQLRGDDWAPVYCHLLFACQTEHDLWCAWSSGNISECKLNNVGVLTISNLIGCSELKLVDQAGGQTIANFFQRE